MQSTEASKVKISNNAKKTSKKKSGVQRAFSIALSIITVVSNICNNIIIDCTTIHRCN